MTSRDDELLAEQIRYYDRRAPIYEQLYFLQGPHADVEPDVARVWRDETAALERFARSIAGGRTLELACGNGLWTRFLAPAADRLVAVDTSPRMLERNAAWVGDPAVDYVEADLFAWDTTERFDLVFAGFFLSHVPPSRWTALWRRIAGWIAPGGRVAFVDDVDGAGITEPLERPADGPPHAHVRRLGDERFVIVKRVFTPAGLESALADVGFTADVVSTGRYFLHGAGEPQR